MSWFIGISWRYFSWRYQQHLNGDETLAISPFIDGLSCKSSTNLMNERWLGKNTQLRIWVICFSWNLFEKHLVTSGSIPHFSVVPFFHALWQRAPWRKVAARSQMIVGGSTISHRIHGAGIYANIGGILMGSMLPYIAAPWILWLYWGLSSSTVGIPDQPG